MVLVLRRLPRFWITGFTLFCFSIQGSLFTQLGLLIKKCHVLQVIDVRYVQPYESVGIVIFFLSCGLWQPGPGLSMHLMMKSGEQLSQPSQKQLSRGLESLTLSSWNFHVFFQLMTHLPLMSQLWMTPLWVPPFWVWLQRVSLFLWRNPLFPHGLIIPCHQGFSVKTQQRWSPLLYVIMSSIRLLKSIMRYIPQFWELIMFSPLAFCFLPCPSAPGVPTGPSLVLSLFCLSYFMHLFNLFFLLFSSIPYTLGVPQKVFKLALVTQSLGRN